MRKRGTCCCTRMFLIHTGVQTPMNRCGNSRARGRVLVQQSAMCLPQHRLPPAASPSTIWRRGEAGGPMMFMKYMMRNVVALLATGIELFKYVTYCERGTRLCLRRQCHHPTRPGWKKRRKPAGHTTIYFQIVYSVKRGDVKDVHSQGLHNGHLVGRDTKTWHDMITKVTLCRPNKGNALQAYTRQPSKLVAGHWFMSCLATAQSQSSLRVCLWRGPNK